MYRALLLLPLLAFQASTSLALPVCLDDEEARTEVQSRKLVSLQQAIMAAKAKSRGDLISAHLCRVQELYMYRISILQRDGRVARLLVNAVSGHLSEKRE
jgi:uncharacterized membrane protein YkoI